MAKVIGPLHSFEATGKVASMVFGVWRGIQWVRQHFIPANPQTAGQVNIRTALRLAVAYYQTMAQADKDEWDAEAQGKPLSGYNLWMSSALDEYMTQLGIGTTPASISYTGPYPGTFTWA